MNLAFKQRRERVGFVTLAIGILFALAVMRLGALVAFDGARLGALARNEHTGETELAAMRGPIVDRKGEALALTAETRSVYARPKRLLANTTRTERAKLAAVLGVSSDQLETRLRKRSPFIWLARQLAPGRAQAAEALGLEGVGALGEYKRFYPESNLAAGVVGLAGLDGQGLSGVELQYDQMIRGEPVRLDFYQDALGNQILDSPLALRGPVPGGQLELTIDSAIQSLAEAELWQQVRTTNAKRGSAIVLDPFSGELLAMANVDTEAATPRDRLKNFAVQDAFEPGSTFKGIVGAIALADGAISSTDQIYCEDGAFKLGRRVIHDHSRHGMLDLAGIIQVSSNIGAAKIALRLGSEKLHRGLTAFGFGRKTGIDLPGEAPGLVRKPETWRTIELANHGFGHGIAVTPIQLAVGYATIANGGLLVRPYAVRTVYDSRGRVVLSHRPQVLGRAISPEVAHTMNTLLRGVVEGPDGTGSRARVDGFVVAGKTGTAQMIDPETGNYYQSRHVSSFVGFVPADDPRLVILVSLFDVGRGRFGGLVAAPVFSRIATGALRELEIYPAEQQYDLASMLPTGPIVAVSAKSRKTVAPADAELPGRVPDFTGLSLRRAFELARHAALNLEVEGEGYVVAQDPEPGAPRSHPTVRLALSPNVRAPNRDSDTEGVHVASFVEPASGAP